MAEEIPTRAIQLKDGNKYKFIPVEPTADNLGGISLQDKNKYDEYEKRIAALEKLIK